MQRIRNANRAETPTPDKRTASRLARTPTAEEITERFNLLVENAVNAACQGDSGSSSTGVL